MIIICAIFSFAISMVNYSTLDLLKKNEKLHLNRVLSNAFMLKVSGEKPEDYEKSISDNIEIIKIKPDKKVITYYKNKSNGNVGFAIQGRGFWDLIKVVIVLTPDLKTIQNIQVLEQKETPGLGARIEELQFTDKFKGINIPWESAIKKRIVMGGPAAQNRIDAITGATQTSIAFIAMINSELNRIKQIHTKGKVK
ncbi:FMN-binding protein [Spirochaetota bacterium]